MRLFKVFVMLAIAGAALVATPVAFMQSDDGRNYDTDMLLGHSTIEVPVRVTVPEGGLAGVTLVATAEGAEEIQCRGPSYTISHCEPGENRSVLTVADINDRWNEPGHVDWVGTFRLHRFDPGSNE